MLQKSRGWGGGNEEVKAIQCVPTPAKDVVHECQNACLDVVYPRLIPGYCHLSLVFLFLCLSRNNVGVRKDLRFFSNGAFVFGAPATQEWCSGD